MHRPLIGVPAQTLQAIDGIPEALPHSWVMNHRYFVALASTGAAPVMIPLLDPHAASQDEATLRAIYDRLDGLFIAGGVDVHPSSYGAALDPLTGRTDLARDAVELRMTRWALAEGKPFFGICRGMQVLNVACGGTLHQDTAAFFPDAIKHDYFPTQGYARDHLAHDLRIAPGSHLHAAFGTETVAINSMHHQGVDRLGHNLVATAWAPDGLIEGIERPHGFAVGAQWHPEMLVDTDAGTQRLFEGFVGQARAWAQRPRLTSVAA
ncbi:MAG: gamma-glutamyl-gamma-aminobutyrate hydrolase family protein [Bacteroidota bacterium]